MHPTYRALSLRQFYEVAVSDAMNDLFFPCSRAQAVRFVLRHWRWLRSSDGPFTVPYRCSH